MSKLKMKHLFKAMKTLNKNNVTELLQLVDSAFEREQIEYSKLSEVQKKSLPEKEYIDSELISIVTGYNLIIIAEFVSAFLMAEFGISEDEALEKIEDINELYKMLNRYQLEITDLAKFKDETDPNESATN